MFTLMPVAAFAADAQVSYVYVEDAEVDVNDAVEVTIDLDAADVTTVYVWFEESANVPSTALVGEVLEDGTVTANVAVDGVLAIDVTGLMDKEVYVAFDRAGEYELHAAIDANPLATYAPSGDTKAESVAKIADAEVKTQSGYDVVVVSSEADSADYALLIADETIYSDLSKATVVSGNYYIEDKDVVELHATGTNGIESVPVSFTLVDPTRNATAPNKGAINGMGSSVYAKDIEIETTSGVKVTDLEVKRSGSVDFEIVATKAGTHRVYVTVGDFDATIKVIALDGTADSIELDYISKTPVNIETTGALGNFMLFKIYDENGTELDGSVSAGDVNSGVHGAMNSDSTTNKNYVAVVEQPADSKIKNDQLKLEYVTATAINPLTGEEYSQAADNGWKISGATFKEEGKYTFRVVLDNGEYAEASIVVKEAGDPVALSIVYDADSVQLGSSIAPKSIVQLDANYVSTSVTDQVNAVGSEITMAVTGVAVDYVSGTTIYVKDDEKYVGTEIKVTVVDEENNLVATKVLTVADEANELVFDTTAVPVDSNKKITVTLVDENGKAVALPATATSTSAMVIVLDKPADSDVTADCNNDVVGKKGQFTFNFSADTVGVYKVQAVLQVKINDAWRYYTGVAEIKVGATGIEDTVVMSIGANKIVVNDEVVAIDAAPMIKDSRTFVPFRALAEAFGATVQFDAATQAVVAELDGTKVVMTIGSEVYTVNGVAKTADVAPFIADGRTYVPVRFAAEAFGITVTPIYAEDGSVADVLFTK